MIFRKKISAQTLPMVFITLLFLIALVLTHIEKINVMIEKIKLQKKADEISLTIGNEMSRSLNAMVAVNQGILKMANQFIFYVSAAVGFTIILIKTGQFKRSARAIKVFYKGGKKLTRAMEKIGQDFDSSLQKLQNQFFENVCTYITKQNILLASEYGLHNIATGMLTEVPERAWTKKKLKINQIGLVQIHPNICDPAVAQRMNFFYRSPSNQEMKKCKTHQFSSFQEYKNYTHVAFSKNSITHASVTYIPQDKMNSAGSKTIQFWKKSASQIQETIFLNQSGEPSSIGKYPYQFLEGTFMICIDVASQWRSFSNQLTLFTIPELIRLKDDFYKHNYFTVTVKVPYRSLKPYDQHKALFTNKKSKEPLKNLSKEKIKGWMNVQSTIRIHGDLSLEKMHFNPSFSQNVSNQPRSNAL